MFSYSLRSFGLNEAIRCIKAISDPSGSSLILLNSLEDIKTDSSILALIPFGQIITREKCEKFFEFNKKSQFGNLYLISSFLLIL
ncbi:hypothetical protein BpHYR1_024335 [Brachionus plicatilis]|uniref:Uncharacterized protein n=1 Tax=Brachionus plicatilis TaxID=10195 RepID=A0A3M7Q9X9_BRAPC|nr:hypothetical protein BpHYR1_024335 [Brachionus plicatilis]